MGELTGLEVFALAKEIEIGLRGTYVKNVYSLGGSQVLRFGRPGGDDAWVVASPRFGVWLSKRVAERAETTRFTTGLRQQLLRRRFVSAGQMAGDRIFDLELGEGDEARHLIVELMPPGNIVVTDSGGRVVLALNEFRSPTRRILRGVGYSAPPQRRRDPAVATQADVAEAISRERTAGGAIGRGFSLPRRYVAEALSRLGVDAGADASTLRGREQEVSDALRGIVREAHESPRPCVCVGPDGEEICVLAPAGMAVKETSGSVSELCDELLLGPSSAEEAAPAAQTGSKRLELEATAAKLTAQAGGLEEQAAKLRRLAAEAAGASTAVGAERIAAAAGVKDRRGFGSQAASASAIYDLAKEMESKANDARRAAVDVSRKMAGAARSKPRRMKELSRRSQEWYEKFRWFTTSGGKLAVGGRDAQSNSILVKKHIEDGDTVYHADLFGSPFFVLKGGRSQTDEERDEVAQATAAFSSAWKTGLGAADAYWVLPEQVSESAPSGEYLARGSFMIKGKKNFVPHNLVEVAVGLGQDGRVLSGPEAAVRKASAAYVVLRPHNEKSSETAKRVKKDLETLAGEGARVSVDEVLRMLPAGGGKVLRRHAASAGGMPRNA
jgi:predicted ribosome quality control (RQC) complex YloA/Tae2 family protein